MIDNRTLNSKRVWAARLCGNPSAIS